jgi:putative SOS response-associated peptidase YedK
MYKDLFHRRRLGEKLYLGSGLEAAFINQPGSSAEFQIAEDINQWHQSEIERLGLEIKTQKLRFEKATLSTKVKTTKKAQDDIRISLKKIEKFERDLLKHEDPTKTRDSDSRIFPFHYFSMLTVNERGQRIIMPVRYLMRPSFGNESYDVKYSGSYNARYDNLSGGFWKDSLESGRRGIMLVSKFYENVATQDYKKNFSLSLVAQEKENQVICFEPNELEYIVVPTVWDVWQKPAQSALYSAALITDEPLPEVQATGHDRTPIFLKESAVGEWLNSTGKVTAVNWAGLKVISIVHCASPTPSNCRKYSVSGLQGNVIMLAANGSL